jgi:hypothetical protein
MQDKNKKDDAKKCPHLTINRSHGDTFDKGWEICYNNNKRNENCFKNPSSFQVSNKKKQKEN